MKKLTSYLKEIEQPEFEEFLNPQKTLISSKDDLIQFEDETGWVDLDSSVTFSGSNLENFSLHAFTSGCVVALKGNLVDGIFVTNNILLLNVGKSLSITNECTFGLVSGLNLSQINLWKKQVECLKKFLLSKNPIKDRI